MLVLHTNSTKAYQNNVVVSGRTNEHLEYIRIVMTKSYVIKTN